MLLSRPSAGVGAGPRRAMTIRGSSRAGDVAIHAAGASSPLPAQADSSHADFPLETCLEGPGAAGCRESGHSAADQSANATGGWGGSRRIAGLEPTLPRGSVSHVAPPLGWLPCTCAWAGLTPTQHLRTRVQHAAQLSVRAWQAGVTPHASLKTLSRAERKSRSRETALSKTDVMILRLLLPHQRFFSSLVRHRRSQRSIAWQWVRVSSVAKRARCAWRRAQLRRQEQPAGGVREGAEGAGKRTALGGWLHTPRRQRAFSRSFCHEPAARNPWGRVE